MRNTFLQATFRCVQLTFGALWGSFECHDDTARGYRMLKWPWLEEAFKYIVWTYYLVFWDLDLQNSYNFSILLLAESSWRLYQLLRK